VWRCRIFIRVDDGVESLAIAATIKGNVHLPKTQGPLEQGRLRGISSSSRLISSPVRARLKTATPPIQPVKPTLRLLWMTRPMVKGPPLCAAFGAQSSCGYHHGFRRNLTRSVHR
jgi:hypothetical protein